MAEFGENRPLWSCRKIVWYCLQKKTRPGHFLAPISPTLSLSRPKFRRRERCSSDHQRFSLNPAPHDILPHRQSQTVWSNYQTSYNDFFEVDITETVTLSPNIQMVLLTSSVQSIYLSTMSRYQSFFVLIGQNCLQLMSVMIIHKYVNIQTSVVGPQ